MKVRGLREQAMHIPSKRFLTDLALFKKVPVTPMSAAEIAGGPYARPRTACIPGLSQNCTDRCAPTRMLRAFILSIALPVGVIDTIQAVHGRIHEQP